jgi:hypothetical protein
LNSDATEFKKELNKIIEKMNDDNVNRVIKFCQTNMNQITLASRLNWIYVNQNAYDYVTKKNKGIELKTISSIQNKNTHWFNGTKNKTNLLLIHCLPNSIDENEHFFLVDKSKLTKKEYCHIDDGYSDKGKGYIPHGLYSPVRMTEKKKFWLNHEIKIEKLKKL